MTVDRLPDADGALWPVTGHWCDTCGWPLIPVGDRTVHPLCETEEVDQ